MRNKALKLLHVIPSVAPRYGGPSAAIIQMCHALQHEGVNVLVTTTDADGPTRLSVSLHTETTYNDVPFVFFPRQFTEALKYSHPLAAWLRHNVARFDIVHIHAVFSHACIAAANACRRSGVPYVVRPLGSLDPWSMKQKRIRKTLLWYAACRNMMLHSAAVHYTTEDERRLAEESLGLRRGAVIPLGVGTDSVPDSSLDSTFATRVSQMGSRPYILVLCRLHPKKNLEMLIHAFCELRKRREFAHWSLVIAGDGDPEYRSALQSLVRSLAADSDILFFGWLDSASKYTALQNASLLALISHQENLGVSVLEALACGVPVLISTHVNLAGDIRESGAGWVVPLDEKVLLHTMIEALRDPVELRRRGSIGRELVDRRFRWPIIARQLIDLYSSLVT